MLVGSEQFSAFELVSLGHVFFPITKLKHLVHSGMLQRSWLGAVNGRECFFHRVGCFWHAKPFRRALDKNINM